MKHTKKALPVILIMLGTAFCIVGVIRFRYLNRNETVTERIAYSRTMESLDRGLICVNTSEGVFLSWRYLGTDSEDTCFSLYRNGILLNQEPITNSTNYVDPDGILTDQYTLYTLVNGSETECSVSDVSVLAEQYLDVALHKPEGGFLNGEYYSYSPGDASVGDLDGDGSYEIILKWDPSNYRDNSESGFTGNVYIDAYKLDGTLLWRIDLGRNIRAGSHYTQFMVYDFDADGIAEMVCKTADGTIDGTGTVIGNGAADYRNEQGYILDGPEYLTLFDGQTGSVLDTIAYEPERGNVTDWGDDYGNRCDRFLACVAYLNGETPSVVMCRGYYTRSVLAAYDIVDRKLVRRWIFDTNDSKNAAYAGQGFHNLAVADADGDGHDEIVYGSACIDHDGTGLFTLGLGHGDSLHVGDYDPGNPGLEAWGCFENGEYGAALWDLDNKGAILLRKTASEDNSRCLAGNFIPGNEASELVLELYDYMLTPSGQDVCTGPNSAEAV